MANLSLTACSFLLKKRNSRGNYLFFEDKVIQDNDEQYNEYSIADTFIRFFKSHSEAIDDSDKKELFIASFKTLTVEKLTTIGMFIAL